MIDAIPWSNLSEEDLLYVDRAVHKPRIARTMSDAWRERESLTNEVSQGSALEERFAMYGRIAHEDPELFGWGCLDHCRYECMHRVELDRGLSYPRKYFGKWPFRRVYFCQEVLSSVYSLLNGLPYIIFSLTGTFRHHTPPVYRWFTLIVSVMWIASAVFHCRDNAVTMYMDYFSAFAGVVANCGAGLHEAVLSESGRAKQIGMGILFFLWVFHSLYLSLIKFDFDWNMTLAIVVAAIGGLFWIIYYIKHRRSKAHAWIPVVATWGLFPLLLVFELNDFAPGSSGLADAHSYWHLSTVPFSVMWVVFMQLESAKGKKVE